jgi:1-acyl-sn-glycerol-3-phosphate acyltransferase
VEAPPRAVPSKPLAHRALYALLRLLSLPTLTCFFRLRVYGRRRLPRRGGAIVASNHQSVLDPVFFCGFLPRPLESFARASLFRGVFGRLIRALNAFPVERGGRDTAAIRGAIERLRAGRALLVFPEGTRTETGAVGAFEPGVAALARRAGVPVVPAAVDGAFEAWPRGRALFRAGAPCAIALGRPIAPGTPDLVERLREETLRLKADLARRNAALRGFAPPVAPAGETA